MKKTYLNKREQSLSLTDQRLQDFTIELDGFFKNSNQSYDLLNILFEQYHPSLSIYESILNIYSNSLHKSKLNQLLDKTIE
ncbi:unnamed protein product [Adineta steineri]|uniref:Uncharacterized protein n=1 Tax=Adineta steineri TaxID=433720 RepID=A0A820BDF0_9BILA|nr:unnamed protein product [Adineta steineri]CAF4204767.1 unnamed protein product [Adineta steineri]